MAFLIVYFDYQELLIPKNPTYYLEMLLMLILLVQDK